MAGDDETKNYDPTPAKREKFHKDGRFARARDLGGLAATSAVLATIVGGREAIGGALAVLFQRCHGELSALSQGRGDTAFSSATGALLLIAGPPALGAGLAAAAAGFAQAGFNFDVEKLEPKFDRMNPLPRLQQLFSFKKGALETLMSMLRTGVIGYVAYRALIVQLPMLLRLGVMSPATSATRVTDALVDIVMHALVALLVIAAIDYAQSRFSLEKEMMMSRKEMMEEQRSQDGDPKTKGRMRARARANAKRAALNDVRKAAVVVTNPTHVAVALRYGPKDPAPIVVAKGIDDFAMEIRARARKYGIPIVENKPLARALNREVAIGEPVRAAHFAAVARVIAFVMRLRGPRSGGGMPIRS